MLHRGGRWRQDPCGPQHDEMGWWARWWECVAGGGGWWTMNHGGIRDGGACSAVLQFLPFCSFAAGAPTAADDSTPLSISAHPTLPSRCLLRGNIDQSVVAPVKRAWTAARSLPLHTCCLSPHLGPLRRAAVAPPSSTDKTPHCFGRLHHGNCQTKPPNGPLASRRNRAFIPTRVTSPSGLTHPPAGHRRKKRGGRLDFPRLGSDDQVDDRNHHQPTTPSWRKTQRHDGLVNVGRARPHHELGAAYRR